MLQTKGETGRLPTRATPSIDPPSVVAESAPAHPISLDEVVAFERRVLFGSGIELQYPARLVWPSPWIGHIPFAFWITEALRPRVMVELGVHSGNSYCAFLQAIQSLGITTQCYGIDHWHGDEHADAYGDDVYAELRSYHDPLYGAFSTLLQASFEEAGLYFSDQSVDLLHIDGLHTYDAVSKDFSDWLPKMSSRGVVLFHDINVRERGFGVWRHWEEIAARYPTVTLVHSHGLGLAYVGSEPPPAPLNALLTMSNPEMSRMRLYFSRLGTSLVDRFGRGQAEATASRVRANEAELEAARTELRRHVEMANAVRGEAAAAAALREQLATATTETDRLREELTDEAASLRTELARSRGLVSEAVTQRERATQLLRQQIAATAGLQRELAALRTNEAAALLVNRLVAIKHRVPRPVKHYIKTYILGLRS
jgi:chemotaxis protein histidine kinase CheA